MWLSVGGSVCVDWLSPSLGPRHRPSAIPTTTCCSRWASSRVSSRSSSRPCKPRSRTTASRFRHAHRLGLWAAHLGVVALARGLGGLAVHTATTACRNSSSRWAFRRAHTPISPKRNKRRDIVVLSAARAHTHNRACAVVTTPTRNALPSGKPLRSPTAQPTTEQRPTRTCCTAP